MIKNLDHARAVQERRQRSGKRGIAKAIKRWLNKQGKMKGVYLQVLKSSATKGG